MENFKEWCQNIPSGIISLSVHSSPFHSLPACKLQAVQYLPFGYQSRFLPNDFALQIIFAVIMTICSGKSQHFTLFLFPYNTLDDHTQPKFIQLSTLCYMEIGHSFEQMICLSVLRIYAISESQHKFYQYFVISNSSSPDTSTNINPVFNFIQNRSV